MKKGLTDLQKSVRPFSLDKFFSAPTNRLQPGCKSASAVLTGAINLLSNGDLKNQKVSIFKGLRTLISTFCLFPLAYEFFPTVTFRLILG